MKINLSEIPEEGRTYKFDRETGELNGVLADLIGDRKYDASFTIKPIGNVYELKGSVNTEIPEVCSLCGWDLDLPIGAKFNEILMHDETEYRKAHSVHGNQSIDFLAEGPAVTYYEGEVFDAGAYVHEAVGLAEPFYPSCGKEDCEHLQEANQKRAELEEEYRRADELRAGHPGFAALKDLLPKN